MYKNNQKTDTYNTRRNERHNIWTNTGFCGTQWTFKCQSLLVPVQTHHCCITYRNPRVRLATIHWITNRNPRCLIGYHPLNYLQKSKVFDWAPPTPHHYLQKSKVFGYHSLNYLQKSKVFDWQPSHPTHDRVPPAPSPHCCTGRKCDLATPHCCTT